MGHTYTSDLSRPLSTRHIRVVQGKGWKYIHKDKMVKISQKSVLRKSLEPYTLGRRPCLSAARLERGAEGLKLAK